MSLLIKKNKKLLVAGGCSYTDPKFYSSDDSLPEEKRHGWPMWPELLAKKVGLKCINTGAGGDGNLSIYKKVLDAINKNEGRVDTVVVLWSGWDRSSIFFNRNIQYAIAFRGYAIEEERLKVNLGDQRFENIGGYTLLENFVSSPSWNARGMAKDMVHESLLLMASLAEICTARGIKYIFYQGVDPLDYGGINIGKDAICPTHQNIGPDNILTYIRFSSASKYLEKNKKNIIGWPFLDLAGGHFYDAERLGIWRGGQDQRNYISELDKHPNAAGQQELCETFYERYHELYSL